MPDVCEIGTAGAFRAFQSESNLSYYRARYYDQSTSRFLSEDPLGLISGGLNSYSYVDSDPEDYYDPFGLRKYKCDFLGHCVHLPSRHPLPPVPSSAGSSLVEQQLNAYRNCVAAGIKGIQDPPPRPPDPTLGILKGSGDMKPNAHPMPGDPSGPFAFPDPKPNPLGAPDGLAVVDDLTRQYNCYKRGKVADDCADRFPLAKLSRQF
jgi:RHS repeat-associated protein